MNKKIPLRQCVGCGEMKNKKEMMRVLKTAEGDIVLDVTGKRTAGVLICAFPVNVWEKQGKTKVSSGPLK